MSDNINSDFQSIISYENQLEVLSEIRKMIAANRVLLLGSRQHLIDVIKKVTPRYCYTIGQGNDQHGVAVWFDKTTEFASAMQVTETNFATIFQVQEFYDWDHLPVNAILHESTDEPYVILRLLDYLYYFNNHYTEIRLICERAIDENLMIMIFCDARSMIEHTMGLVLCEKPSSDVKIPIHDIVGRIHPEKFITREKTKERTLARLLEAIYFNYAVIGANLGHLKL